MDALDDQMDVHSRKMEALSAQMEQLTEKADNDVEINAASRRMVLPAPLRDQIGRAHV